MSHSDPTVTFERLTDLDADAPTLVEGMPGHGLVAAIAVEQVTEQLRLEHHGNVHSDAFPPTASFEEGRVRDVVRVYAGDDPPVMTLQSDIALPPEAFKPLSKCVLRDLAPEFGRAVFLAGAPAESEEEIGQVTGVATTDRLEDELVEAGIDLNSGPGLLSGVTGALVNECYHARVPAAVLIVRANPHLPDPSAARAVIEDALEPLVDFDIDTTTLQRQADRIREQLAQVAEHHRQMTKEEPAIPQQQTNVSMFQ